MRGSAHPHHRGRGERESFSHPFGMIHAEEIFSGEGVRGELGFGGHWGRRGGHGARGARGGRGGAHRG